MDHLEVEDGAGWFALDNAAMETEQLDGLYDTGEVRGRPGLPIEGLPGELAQRIMPGPKRILVPVLVHADVDPDGNPHTDPAAGLEANLDTLKRLLRPRLDRVDGVFTVRHVRDAGDRDARVHVPSPLATTVQGAGAARVVIDFYLPGGVWRDVADTEVTSAAVADGATGTLDVPNPGSAEQFQATLLLTGTAASTTIVNTSWSGAELTVGADLSDGDVEISTGHDFTAVQAGLDVHGLVDGDTPHLPAWLPLAAGQDNTLEISPVGGEATLTVTHRPAWR